MITTQVKFSKTVAHFFVAGLVVFLFAAHLESAPITIEQVSYAGTGCPDGTVNKSIGEEKGQAVLDFNEFHVEAGNTNGSQSEIKYCDMFIRLLVPKGKSISNILISYGGNYQIPSQGAGNWVTAYHHGRAEGPTFTRQHGNSTSNVLIIDRLDENNAVFFSNCGENVTLSAKLILEVSTNDSRTTSFYNLNTVYVEIQETQVSEWGNCDGEECQCGNCHEVQCPCESESISAASSLTIPSLSILLSLLIPLAVIL